MLEMHNKHEAPAIEICPTSNLITLGLKSYSQHPHIKKWLDLNYPISLNTDDRGVFNTTLTQELLHVQKSMGLDIADIVKILGKCCCAICTFVCCVLLLPLFFCKYFFSLVWFRVCS